MKYYRGLIAMFVIAAVCTALAAWLQHKAFVDPVKPDPPWVEIDCGECSGTGSVEGQKCKYCVDGVWELDGKRLKCPLCLGTGKRIGVCPMCGGKGKMYLEKR